MPVLSSEHVVEHAQRDGRAYVLETHTLTAGLPVLIEYLAEVGADYIAIRTARQAIINELLALAEFERALAFAGWRPLDHQTGAEFAARFRERFRRSSREEAAALAYWIIERINAGDVGETAVRNAFGLSLAQWSTLKTTKLIPLHDAWAAALLAQGE